MKERAHPPAASARAWPVANPERTSYIPHAAYQKRSVVPCFSVFSP